MKSKTILRNIFLASIWLVLAGLCVYLYPHQNFSFKYHYEVGKPWVYDALIVDEAFPIYKTETQLQEEQAEVLQAYTPYYQIDETLAEQQTNKIMQLPTAQPLTPAAEAYLRTSIARIYGIGVLSADGLEQARNYPKISILTAQRVAHTIPTNECFTPSNAYSEIIHNAPSAFVLSLRTVELEKYLIPNLQYDTVTSEKVRNDLLASVAPTQGIVDAGVKIIDTGDIVTEEIAQKLNSLRIIYQDKQGDHKQQLFALVGSGFLVGLFLSLLVVYLAIFRRSFFLSTRDTLFFALLIGMLIALTYVTLRFTALSVYIVPFAWIPILVRVFYDSRTAYMMHLTTVLLAAIMTTRPIEIHIVQIFVGIMMVSSLL